MLKKIFTFVLIFTCCMTAFSQEKPRVGILPFTGGAAGESEIITILFSYHIDILDKFTIVPITNAVNALVMGYDFQLSGNSDSDTLARIGRMLDADFVISGYIRNLGDRNQVIITVINVNTYELLAGVYREYQKLDEIPDQLPDMAGTIIEATRRSNFALPRLAVAPVNIADNGVRIQEAETLAHILAIEIANTGEYSVLPRAATINAVMHSPEYWILGYTAAGRAVNADYILLSEVQSIGNSNLFSASIQSVEGLFSMAADRRAYIALRDGTVQIADLARQLVLGVLIAAQPVLPPELEYEFGIESELKPELEYESEPSLKSEPEPVHELLPRPEHLPPPVPETDQAPQPAQPEQPYFKPVKKPYFSDVFDDPTRLWTLGASVGTSFAVPWVIGTVHGTIAPFKYSFLELGCDFGFVSRSDKVDSYYSIYPFAHLAFFIPFSKGGWYAGGGAGYMLARYSFPEAGIAKNILALNLTTGFNLFDIIDISYTWRVATDFKSASNKLSVGYTYRF